VIAFALRKRRQSPTKRYPPSASLPRTQNLEFRILATAEALPTGLPRQSGTKGSTQRRHPQRCRAAFGAARADSRTTQAGHLDLVPGNPVLEEHGGRCAAPGLERSTGRRRDCISGSSCKAADFKATRSRPTHPGKAKYRCTSASGRCCYGSSSGLRLPSLTGVNRQQSVEDRRRLRLGAGKGLQNDERTSHLRDTSKTINWIHQLRNMRYLRDHGLICHCSERY
jgi:hypothetical protein